MATKAFVNGMAASDKIFKFLNLDEPAEKAETVKENLLLGNPKASDSDLWSVLDRCNLSAFLKSEKGLDTILTENAGNLSGGQKQRLALARAILHNSPIYIFDEATSNIDVESEEVILSEIRRLSMKKASPEVWADFCKVLKQRLAFSRESCYNSVSLDLLK